MDITLSSIVGFLGGSLLTLIVKEVLNQINKKIDYNRDLNKITYQRKLQIAENAIAYYWTYLNKAIEIQKSVETLVKAAENEESEQDIDFIEQMLVKNSQLMEELGSHKYYDINSIHLYFDLDDSDKWNEEDLTNLYECLAEARFHNINLQEWLKIHNHSNENHNDQGAEHAWSQIELILPKYTNSLKSFADILKRNRVAMLASINKIKEDIGK
ncbi:hypothetical protein C900_04369 [Fulvivirga imtechensis AK7]|uniref:Uncharacterized protein n=1 Tax=Fulvivirga imtechensis AK7 TaxID=1237149 RepID=L8K232_9BACT|nr:hypothetical protein [Fulvivirga imtechensis]ELR73517.1 hypothetical protein C900_04369 [Fulvivirga imtechensis AK7]